MAENITTVRNSLAIKVFKYWLPVLIMLAVMYNFSTDLFSGENTRSLIERILAWFTSDVSSRTVRVINYGVRKVMHFFEYAVLAGLLFRAFRADSRALWRASWAIYSLLIIICWAALDEYHQLLTELRGGSVYDVLLDISGGIFMLAAIAFYNHRRN